MELKNYVLAAKLRMPRYNLRLKDNKQLIVQFIHSNGCYEASVLDGTYEIIRRVKPRVVSVRSLKAFYKDVILEIKYGEFPFISLN